MNSTSAQGTTHKRYGILALIFVSVVINYMDRSNISIAAGAMSDDLGLSTVQMGLIFSAFAWTYASLQIPGGILADVVKPRILYTIMLSLWSLATMVQGFANSLFALIGSRMSIGVFEAPSYPTNNKIVTNWFPVNERASAIAIYTSGQYIGLAFLSPLLVFIQSYLGWRGLFIVSGLIGLVWAGVWYLFYRDPKNHKSISTREMEHIRAGGGLVETAAQDKTKSTFSWQDLSQVVISRKLWGIYTGQFCLGAITMFFLTWFPTYLVKYRGLDFIKSGFLISVPYLAAFAGILFSGFISDFLSRKGVSKEIARKVPVIGGMLLSVVIIGANYTDNTFFIILFLALAFFGNGFASITWVFVSLLAPKKLIGLTGGVFNAIGGLSAIVVPAAIGFLVKEGDFAPALYFIGGLAFLGFFSYIFLVGKVERVGED